VADALEAISEKTRSTRRQPHDFRGRPHKRIRADMRVLLGAAGGEEREAPGCIAITHHGNSESAEELPSESRAVASYVTRDEIEVHTPRPRRSHDARPSRCSASASSLVDL
jgi:hypothetical protein